MQHTTHMKMVSDKYNITPVTSSYNNKEEHDKKRRSAAVWTEVVSKHNKRHSNNNSNVNDPFAGMKSSVDYEQEIERLKQIVPKAPRQIKQQHNRHQDVLLLSRSNSPDTTHSSDSDSSLPEPQSVISKEERARFIAFVRSWTGDWKGGYSHNDDDDELMNNDNYSLWAEQSPWTTRPLQYHQQHPYQHHQYYNNNSSNPLIISMPHSTTLNDNHTNFTPTANTNTTTNVTNTNTAVHPIHSNNTTPYYDLYWQTQPANVQTPPPTSSTSSSYTHWQNNQLYSTLNRHGQQPIGMGRSLLKGRTNSPFVL